MLKAFKVIQEISDAIEASWLPIKLLFIAWLSGLLYVSIHLLLH